MFDVSWTDPNRENVGQRRVRKGLERERSEKKRKDDELSQSARASVSTRSSASSTDKSFGIFGSKSSKKSLTPSTATKLSQLRTPSSNTQPRKYSLLSTPTLSTSHSNKLAPVQPMEGSYAPEQLVESGEISPADRSSKGVDAHLHNMFLPCISLTSRFYRFSLFQVDRPIWANGRLSLRFLFRYFCHRFSL